MCSDCPWLWLRYSKKAFKDQDWGILQELSKRGKPGTTGKRRKCFESYFPLVTSILQRPWHKQKLKAPKEPRALVRSPPESWLHLCSFSQRRAPEFAAPALPWAFSLFVSQLKLSPGVRLPGPWAASPSTGDENPDVFTMLYAPGLGGERRKAKAGRSQVGGQTGQLRLWSQNK